MFNQVARFIADVFSKFLTMMSNNPITQRILLLFIFSILVSLIFNWLPKSGGSNETK